MELVPKNQENCKYVKPPMSRMRKLYFGRLVGRILIFFYCLVLCFKKSEEFEIIRDMNFFKRFSVLHILWFLWIIDMLSQLIPIQKKLALGSKKVFSGFFIPAKELFNPAALKEYVIKTTKAAYKVMLLWAAFIVLLGVLFLAGLRNSMLTFMTCVVFYVSDLICVLIWCPFRLILKNRCCTTCRIFNWDHLMMFSPFVFVKGFYSWSLLLMSIAVWLFWELCVYLYPERFWETSNEALRCTACTDKLCTQYCQKLR